MLPNSTLMPATTHVAGTYSDAKSIVLRLLPYAEAEMVKPRAIKESKAAGHKHAGKSIAKKKFRQQAYRGPSKSNFY